MQKYKCIFVVIYLFYGSLGENYNLSEVTNILLNEEGYINPIPNECTVALDEFAQSAANFTLCSITKARPVRLCENCVDDYINFSTKYQQMLDTKVNDTSCRSYLISRDRFDVVLEYHDHITAVWNKGHCDDCFDYSGGLPRLSNNTQNFNKMADETRDCIKSTVTNNTQEICIKCMQFYLKLNDFYGTLSKDAIGVDSVCMDTVDLMNSTRAIWSKKLDCCSMRKSPEIVFLCCTAIISLLPFLYYIIVRYYGPIRDLPNVLKQSRFKQSLLRSVSEITN